MPARLHRCVRAVTSRAGERRAWAICTVATRRNPEEPARPWQRTQAEFLGQHKVYPDFSRWSEAYHLGYAKRWVKSSLRRISTDRGLFAVAEIHGEPGNVVLLQWAPPDEYERGRWLPVGAYRGMELGISDSARGRGLGAEMVLEAERLRGKSFYGERGFSPAGLAAFKAAHRLAVRQALIEGKPVPRRVAAEYPGAVEDARREVERRVSGWERADAVLAGRQGYAAEMTAAALRRGRAAKGRLATIGNPAGQLSLLTRSAAPRIVAVESVIDTRQYEEQGDRWVPIPGSGVALVCSRCGRGHEVHAHVLLGDGSRTIVGTGCAAKESMEIAAQVRRAESAAKTAGQRGRKAARLRATVARLEALLRTIPEGNRRASDRASYLSSPPITVETLPPERYGQTPRYLYRCGDAHFVGWSPRDWQSDTMVVDAWRQNRRADFGWRDRTPLEAELHEARAALRRLSR